MCTFGEKTMNEFCKNERHWQSNIMSRNRLRRTSDFPVCICKNSWRNLYWLTSSLFYTYKWYIRRKKKDLYRYNLVTDRQTDRQLDSQHARTVLCIHFLCTGVTSVHTQAMDAQNINHATVRQFCSLEQRLITMVEHEKK